MAQNPIPPPPPGFQPVDDSQQAAIPPPPAGFQPLDIPDNSVTQTGPNKFQGPNVVLPYSFKALGQGLGDLGKGVAEGPVNDASNIIGMLPGKYASKISGNLGSLAQPANNLQSLGRGIEQAGEFFVPGGAEESLAAKASEAVPFLGKTLPKIGAQALSSGAVNALQGGSFGGGALAGGTAGLFGAGLKALAPTMAETALGVRAADRGFGRTPGQAIIQDTTGVRPGTIANQAQSKMGALTGELEDMHDAVSQRLTQRPPIRGALPAPTIDMPLHSAPDIPGTPSQPIVLNQADRPMQNLLPAPTRTLPSSSYTDIFPDQLPQGSTNIPTSGGGQASGMGPGQYLGQIPGDRGGPGQVQGVLRSRPTSFPAGDGTQYQIPLGEGAPSMGPARNIVQSALEKAVNQNSPQLFNALQPVQDQLSRNFFTGANIADRVTPTDMLGYKRGIGKLENSWPLETKKVGGDTIRDVYGALDSELDRTVPGSQQMNQRISSLFPVASRAGSADLNANLLQRSLGRFARPTGALASGIAGGYSGYEKGGTPGAIAGGAAGLFLPEVLASPTTMMLGARALDLFGQPAARATQGLGAQLFRKQSPPTK